MSVSPTAAVLDRIGLDALVKDLGPQGRTAVGPTVRDGAVILAELDTEPAARGAVAAARDRMGRAMPPVNLRTLMGQSLAADRWDDVAARCLTCGNRTMVWPTCFCTTTEEITDLSGDHAERWQRRDSCFDLDFSYLHGGAVRSSLRGRYRQWLTHKLSTWHDQFGSSGCVCCGLCITWCPGGINITEEAAALHDELVGRLRTQERREPEQ